MSKVSKLNAVTLSEPVEIDGNPVTEITLRKPKTGELRGLALTDILRMEVGALTKLLPRITQPPLNESQIANLEPADFTDLAGKTMLFFVKQEQLHGQILELEATS